MWWKLLGCPTFVSDDLDTVFDLNSELLDTDIVWIGSVGYLITSSLSLKIQGSAQDCYDKLVANQAFHACSCWFCTVFICPWYWLKVWLGEAHYWCCNKDYWKQESTAQVTLSFNYFLCFDGPNEHLCCWWTFYSFVSSTDCV